jgi:hypothetical protein
MVVARISAGAATSTVGANVIGMRTGGGWRDEQAEYQERDESARRIVQDGLPTGAATVASCA